eukprot:759529-Hanusia_phi.AAC.13
MCKFVQTCPLFWEEKKQEVMTTLFALLGDKAAGVRLQAMHALAAICNVLDEGTALLLVNLVEGTSRIKSQSGVGLLSLLARQYSLTLCLHPSSHARQETRPLGSRCVSSGSVSGGCARLAAGDSCCSLLLSSDSTQVLWTSVILEAASQDEETSDVVAHSIMRSGMFNKLQPNRTMLRGTLSMLLYILAQCKTRSNLVPMADFLVAVLLSAYNNISIAPFEAVVQLVNYARMRGLLEDEQVTPRKLELTGIMTRKMRSQVKEVRASAMEALGYIAEPNDQEVLTAMIDATLDEDAETCNKAHLALRRMCMDSANARRLPLQLARASERSVSHSKMEQQQRKEGIEVSNKRVVASQATTVDGRQAKLAQVQVYWSYSFKCQGHVQEKIISIKDAVVNAPSYENMSDRTTEKEEYDSNEYRTLEEKLEQEIEVNCPDFKKQNEHS